MFLVATVVVAIGTGAAAVLGGSIVQILFVTFIVLGVIALIAAQKDDKYRPSDGQHRWQ